MEELRVIAKVNEPTDWSAGMVVVPKENSKSRICVDQTRLNQSVCREKHPLPAVEPTLALFAGARVFTTLDTISGFWQIPLSPESALHNHNLHYAIWAILFSPTTIWDHQCTRTLSASDIGNPEWSSLYDG